MWIESFWIDSRMSLVFKSALLVQLLQVEVDAILAFVKVILKKFEFGARDIVGILVAH